MADGENGVSGVAIGSVPPSPVWRSSREMPNCRAFCRAIIAENPPARAVRLVTRSDLTLIVRDGVIETVFYPVFPPNESADQVIRWLSQNPL
jgi:hypothetical protein